MLKSINRIVRIMIISDFFFNSAWGFIYPVFALFIVQKITGDTIKAAEVAGFAALFYWVIKAVLQIPVGRYLDKSSGETDDFWFMFSGHIIVGFVPFGYILASLSWHIYLLQIVYAIGMGLMIPPWYAILSRHIDKGHEAFEWGISSTSLGIATGITGALGGLIVAFYGFTAIFILCGTINLLSGFLLFYAYADLKKVDIKHYPSPPFKV